MRLYVLLPLWAILNITLSVGHDSKTIPQDPGRAWGEPARGLRISIALENTRIPHGGPFPVSLVVESISEAAFDEEVICSFHLEASSIPSPLSSSEIRSPISDYWCPVSLMGENRPGKSGLIMATRSRLVLEKGAALRTTLDLSRFGWDRIISSIWPEKELDAIVPHGNYILKTRISITRGDNRGTIQSNELEVVIGDQ